MTETQPPRTRGARRQGRFRSAGALVQPQIRKAGETRGFAVSRLFTHWAEVVGPDLAALCRPVKVGYGRGGLGATLTVLARGAAGPILQAQLPRLRERVNACYGYNAVARIQITQTSATGFAEPQAPFAPAGPAPREADPQAETAADALTAEIADPELRAALAGLGRRILTPKSR